MKLELWLDESGDFKNDQNVKLNPSLVGGVLVQESVIDEAAAEKILGKSFVHFTDEVGGYNIDILENMKDKGAEFVIFQNAERVTIIDSDTTYLNVLAEGIIQLLLQLSAAHGDFELQILVATKKNMNKGYGIISPEEYERRLRERIIVGLARKALTKENDWKYKIRFDDARINKKLMLADGVCNTYLTRTSGKFTPSQKETIIQLYKTELVFSFFENNIEKEILRWITEGNLSDAIFQIFTAADLENKEYFLGLVLNRLKELDDHSKKIQLSQLSSKIQTLIKIDRKYLFIKPILEEIQANLLPKLEEKGIQSVEFHLDIILFLYTIYTHEGSIQAETQDTKFLTYLPLVEDIMTKFKYYNLYKIRKGVHEKNMLKMYDSIDNLSKAIKVLEDMIQMTEMLEDETLTGDISKIRYEELGKAYGTRGQAYSALIHDDSDYLQFAIRDFDHALEHFSIWDDKERQYLYKSLAYCEGKLFHEALEQLFRACQLTFNHDQYNFKELLDYLKGQKVHRVIFKYSSFFKIMAYAKASDENRLADAMFDSLNQSGVTTNYIRKQYEGPHPMQFIYWYMASYSMLKGKRKLANQYLDEAIDKCNSLPMGAITFKILQLGMLAEKISFNQNSLDVKHLENELFALYEQIKSQPNVSAMLEYLGFLEDSSKENVIGEDLNKLIVLTKCLN